MDRILHLLFGRALQVGLFQLDLKLLPALDSLRTIVTYLHVLFPKRLLLLVQSALHQIQGNFSVQMHYAVSPSALNVLRRNPENTSGPEKMGGTKVPGHFRRRCYGLPTSKKGAQWKGLGYSSRVASMAERRATDFGLPCCHSS